MKLVNRMLPLSLLVLLVVPVMMSYSVAYASESPAGESGIVSYAESNTGPDVGDESPEEPPASTGMFDTTASLGQAIMSGVWSLFGIYVPGFSFTFGQMWLGVLLCSVSILVIRMIFGFGGGPRGDSPRTSSTNNPKISKERRHDEF